MALMGPATGNAVDERRELPVVALARTGGQIVVGLLALALAFRALTYFWYTIPIVRWPFEIYGGEATMLHESRLLSADPLDGLRAIYGPQVDDRFLAGNYPPLYLSLWALRRGASSFITGRAISLLAGVLVIIAATAAGYATQRLTTGVLGAALTICTIPVFQQLGVAKPDMVAFACAAAGLTLYEAFPSRRGAVAAGIVFALGLLAKQSVAFAVIAAAIRRGPRALRNLLLGVGATLAVVLGGLWLLAGPALVDHLVLYNRRPWNADRFDDLNRRFLQFHWPLLVLGFGYAAWGLRARPRSALTYYPFVAALSFATVGSQGGGRNYYIELCLATGLGSALAVATLLRARVPLGTALGLAAALLVGWQTVQTYVVFTRGAHVHVPSMERRDLNPLLAAVDAQPDPVLSDDVGYLAMRGRPVIVDDPYLLEILCERGDWADAALVAAVRARRYAFIYMPRARDEDQIRNAWGDAFVVALNANYRPIGPFSYVPRQP